MKFRIILLVSILVILVMNVSAARFSFLTHTVKQPDGSAISCFVSGDEFFNWLHNQEGYTIIQGDDGYYYWGMAVGGKVVPSQWRAGTTDPAAAGLKTWAKISLEEYNRRKAFYAENTDQSVKAPHLGIMNNLVVYIRFNDDTEFTTTRQTYDNKFNLPTGNSLKSYYSEVSYQSFTINSTHYPECAMTTNFSYQDYHDRNYFEPYNATSNPGGYSGDSQRRYREHTLLKDAITWINANSPVPANLDIDGDLDGNVDNVCFIIRGGNGAWAELLWAHRWSLYSENVYINGKRVYDYTFQPETQVDVTTLCHEMFHALGSPDLYHYTEDGKAPVGPWDLMENGSGHMGAYMKWKYTENSWIEDVPLITVSGTYTLHPLTTATNNCYRIASPYHPQQFFVLEYRQKGGTFEKDLPGSGLLVYRIDPTETGNASGPPDEVYVYRPGGTPNANGTTNNAYFSAGVHRTKINDRTNPSSFLQNGSVGGLDISNITEADSTISFTVNVIDLDDPTNYSAISTSISEILVKWHKNASGSKVMIAYNTSDQFGAPNAGTAYAAGGTITGGGTVLCNTADTTYLHTGLQASTRYYYKAWSVLPGNTYSTGLVRSALTLCGSIQSLPFTEGFEGSADRPDCWYEDSADLPWQFVAGNGLGSPYGYPATAHSGLRNACLVDATVAPDFNTLATPVFDLSGYSGVQLKFWMFMQKWGTRQDELKIYYRTNPGLPWVLLQSFTQSVPAWTLQTIDLPAGLMEAQIGFGGNARWALGICIDDIEITGIPMATLSIAPASQSVSMAAGTTAFSVATTVDWTAVSDASWCSVTASGSGNGTITATYTENPLYSKRTATITLTAAGLQPQTVTITQDASNISVDELASGPFRIYPNPASDFCRIVAREGSARLQEVTLCDFTGRTVSAWKCNGEAEFLVNLSSLAQGTYMLKIKGEGVLVTRKLVITR